MKKTISINISGLIFNIDEDAYQRLSQYFESIRLHFNKVQGSDDIVADIESRVAELLQRKINEQKQVITLSDINEVIAALGQPFEMDDEQKETEDDAQTLSSGRRSKRLFRDTDNKKLGGVAAGLSAYFAIDALWIRILFVILFLSSGVGFFVYIALWIFVPEAYTTAEKLEMRGEPVNVATIEQSIKKEYESVKGKINEYAADAKEGFQRTSRNAGHAASRMNDPVMQIIRGIARFLSVVFGLIFLVLGSLLMLIAGSAFLGWDNLDLFTGMELPLAGGEQLYQLLLAGPLSVSLAPAVLGAFIAIPLVMLVYAGLRLLIGEAFKIPGLSNVATGLWIASVVGLFYIGTTLVIDTKETFHNEEKPVYFSTSSGKILYINTLDQDIANQVNEITFFDQSYFLSSDEKINLINSRPSLYFRTTDEKVPYLVTTRSANGKTYEKARERTEDLRFIWQSTDSSFAIAKQFSFQKDDKLRNQRIEMWVYLPEGQMVELDNQLKWVVSESMRHRLYSNVNKSKLWIMTSEGLKPMEEEE